MGEGFEFDDPAWEESKGKDGPDEGSIWGSGLPKEFTLLVRTRGPVGNADCCCWVMLSLARPKAAMSSEGAGLGACQ